MKKFASQLNISGVVGVVALIALWELYKRTLGAEFESIASVSDIARALRDLLIDGVLLERLFHTLSVSIIGWLIASALGLVMGAAIGWSRFVWTYTMASVDVLRSIPSISLTSIALLVFGFSQEMELVIVVYVSQWPVLLATASGLRAAPAGLIDTARSLRLSPAATIFKVLLPAALPSILVGMRLALTLSVALAVVAEMVGNPAGLGFGLVYAQQAVRPAEAFAYMVVIGLLGWSLNFIFVQIVNRGFLGHDQVT